MNWLWIGITLISALGMGGFYYLMELSPKGLRGMQVEGKPFQMPDMRLHYGAEALYAGFAQAGDNRPRMRRYWLLDFGFIVCFLGVMLAIGRNIAHANDTLRWWMAVAACARAALDILENLLLLSLLRAYPACRDGWAAFAGWVTTAKYLCLFAWVAALFVNLFGSAFGIQL
ncbi:MAG TPA: hypothetical protein PLP25_09205 [Candidatus Limiplasma sp.]|nr:hypothetical protein [Candidatus Limiplasma sp.]HPS82020.1 hypothetical protein [Candidatus Limiplasma sp.]